MDDVDHVFKALADPIRRLLLDRLRKRDGQTLVELCDGIELTRFGVMKHLKVLEQAHLVVTRRVGREKHHYLNRVPIRRIHDRWVSRYTAPIAQALLDLQQTLEAIPMNDPNDNRYQVYELFIRTTPERLWQAITDPAYTKHYLFQTTVRSTWQRGAPIDYDLPDGKPGVSGEVIECDPPKKLVQTWTFRYDPELAKERSKVTWLIEQRGKSCKLTVHHDMMEAPKSAEHTKVMDGWTYVLSGLKTYLETGESLEVGKEGY